jgi:ATP-dependent protease ClpP protease subunit
MRNQQVFVINKVLYFFGPINRRNANTFVKHMLVYNPKKIVLSSEGGLVTEAVKMCETIRLSSNINIQVQGAACSAATFILASATGKRSMTRHSHLMYHLPYTSDENSSKNSLCHHACIEELSFLETLLKPILLNRNSNNKKALDFYQKFTTNNKDFYLTAKEALDIGLIDKIV